MDGESKKWLMAFTIPVVGMFPLMQDALHEVDGTNERKEKQAKAEHDARQAERKAKFKEEFEAIKANRLENQSTDAETSTGVSGLSWLDGKDSGNNAKLSWLKNNTSEQGASTLESHSSALDSSSPDLSTGPDLSTSSADLGGGVDLGGSSPDLG